MRKAITYLLLVLGLPLLNAQYKIGSQEELEALRGLPMEKMYVHASSSLVFPGEYLYFKVYTINSANYRLSTTSALAYADLVNPEGAVVKRIKLSLQNGMARGDFFINGDLPSGDYRLVVYSNWMKNGGLEQAFRQPLRIINPYRNDGIGTSEISSPAALAVNTPINTESQLQLQTEQSRYGLRSPVQLTLRNYLGNLGHGNYSLLVRKKNELPAPELIRAYESQKLGKEQIKTLDLAVGDSIYLPEQRGELFYGQLLDASGSVVGGKEILLSIPGDDYLLKATTTDENGNFYLYLKDTYKQRLAIAQVPEDETYTIEIHQPTPLAYNTLTGNPLSLDINLQDQIIQRSIQNQLENAFFEVKPDSLLPVPTKDPFDGGLSETFVLDAYTRFPTFEETLVEILNYVGYRSGGEHADYIRVLQDFETFNEPYNDYPALVLVDGLLVPNHEALKGFNALQIDSIQVVRDPIVFGSGNYQGIVAIHTRDGNFHETYATANSRKFELTPVEQEKLYYRQSYGQEGKYDRIPDFRRILLWEPNVDLSGPEKIFEFFTSDIPGTYEVILEGFTSYGKPISLREEISVVE